MLSLFDADVVVVADGDGGTVKPTAGSRHNYISRVDRHGHG